MSDPFFISNETSFCYKFPYHSTHADQELFLFALEQDDRLQQNVSIVLGQLWAINGLWNIPIPDEQFSKCLQPDGVVIRIAHSGKHNGVAFGDFWMALPEVAVPDEQTVTLHVVHKPDGSTDWEDFRDDQTDFLEWVCRSKPFETKIVTSSWIASGARIADVLTLRMVDSTGISALRKPMESGSIAGVCPITLSIGNRGKAPIVLAKADGDAWHFCLRLRKSSVDQAVVDALRETPQASQNIPGRGGVPQWRVWVNPAPSGPWVELYLQALPAVPGPVSLIAGSAFSLEMPIYASSSCAEESTAAQLLNGLTSAGPSAMAFASLKILPADSVTVLQSSIAAQGDLKAAFEKQVKDLGDRTSKTDQSIDNQINDLISSKQSGIPTNEHLRDAFSKGLQILQGSTDLTLSNHDWSTEFIDVFKELKKVNDTASKNHEGTLNDLKKVEELEENINGGLTLRNIQENFSIELYAGDYATRKQAIPVLSNSISGITGPDLCIELLGNEYAVTLLNATKASHEATISVVIPKGATCTSVSCFWKEGQTHSSASSMKQVLQNADGPNTYQIDSVPVSVNTIPRCIGLNIVIKGLAANESPRQRRYVTLTVDLEGRASTPVPTPSVPTKPPVSILIHREIALDFDTVAQVIEPGFRSPVTMVTESLKAIAGITIEGVIGHSTESLSLGLDVERSAKIGGSLDVHQSAKIHGNVSVTGDLTVSAPPANTGTSAKAPSVDITGKLTVRDSVDITGTLTAAGIIAADSIQFNKVGGLKLGYSGTDKAEIKANDTGDLRLSSKGGDLRLDEHGCVAIGSLPDASLLGEKNFNELIDLFKSPRWKFNSVTNAINGYKPELKAGNERRLNDSNNVTYIEKARSISDAYFDYVLKKPFRDGDYWAVPNSATGLKGSNTDFVTGVNATITNVNKDDLPIILELIEHGTYTTTLESDEVGLDGFNLFGCIFNSFVSFKCSSGRANELPDQFVDRVFNQYQRDNGDSKMFPSLLSCSKTYKHYHELQAKRANCYALIYLLRNAFNAPSGSKEAFWGDLCKTLQWAKEDPLATLTPQETAIIDNAQGIASNALTEIAKKTMEATNKPKLSVLSCPPKGTWSAADRLAVPSIFTDGSIVAFGGVRSVSDGRVKTDLQPSHGGDDLERFSRIAVRSYRRIGRTGEGDIERKVVAQELEEVFPEAVSHHSGVLPDLHCTAKIVDRLGGIVETDAALQPGGLIDLIDIAGRRHTFSVVDCKDGKATLSGALPEGDEIYLFGHHADDVRSVDYAALSMLHLSATQEMQRRFDKRIRSLERKLAATQKALAKSSPKKRAASPSKGKTTSKDKGKAPIKPASKPTSKNTSKSPTKGRQP